MNDVARTSGDVVATAENLTVVTRRGNAAVLVDVSLGVNSGEVLGLVGESGSGKTTLGLAMLGHVRRGLRIGGGSSLFRGQELNKMGERELRRLRGRELAYVPQDPGVALNPAIRVGSQLLESLSEHGIVGQTAVDRVQELLSEVGFARDARVLDRFPHQLSGGQQQRVAIAMAFACRPHLIVLDEPTTGLDVSTQRTVMATVARMCSTYHVAAIYVSHDVAAVSELATRIAVLYSGRVVELGPAAEVLSQPAHPYTQGLLRAVPTGHASERLVAMPGTPPRPGRRPPGCSFAPRCPVRMPACDEQPPVLQPVAGDGHHAAACLLVGHTPAAKAFAQPAPDRHAEQSPSASQPLIESSALCASYSGSVVLHGLDFVVPTDSCVALVGESGSGKTTLARCIAGLHAGWEGQIAYAGNALPHGIRGRAPQTLRTIQYIFQNPYASLNPRRTVGGLIAQPLRKFEPSRRDLSEAVTSALESVSLSPELAERYPDELSGGERQRVAIARALVTSPRLLICDEVTSALDVSVQAAIVELLRRLQRERQMTIIFITHNLPLVGTLAQHVTVMQAGRIVETGSAAEVLQRPTHPYTQSLLEHVPRLATPQDSVIA